jgi:hypothetical protein
MLVVRDAAEMQSGLPHALWHLATAPIAVVWYDFRIRLIPVGANMYTSRMYYCFLADHYFIGQD